MFQRGYGLLSVWSKDSDDNCDREVGEPVPKMKKQTRNIWVHWETHFLQLEYNMFVQYTILISYYYK